MLDTTQWTPALAHQRHKDFHRKIAEQAAKLAAEKAGEFEPVSEPAPEPVERPVKLPEPKTPWFAIVDDCAVRDTVFAIKDIQELCARHFGITYRDLVSDMRSKEYMRPRLAAYLLCRKFSGRGTIYIGSKFGGRDHSSVISGARRALKLIKTDPAYKAVVDGICADLGVSIDD